jgi:phenylacetate-coenzyme A ligase PaaK-like adenylate-forming protein
MAAPTTMPTLLHPDDPAFHRMVAAFEGKSERWLAVNRALRDAMVSYAVERSPYYRSMSGGAFEDLPILTKEILRTRHDDLIAEGVHRDRWAVDETSGSLGPAVRFVRDTAQGYLENVSALRFLRWMQGIPPDATRVWIGSAPQPPRGHRRRRGKPDPETHPVRAVDLHPERLRSEARVWAGFRAYYLYGHASVLSWIGEQVETGQVDLPKRPLSVVTTADTLTDHGAGRLGRFLGVPVHSWYGSREMNGFVAGTLPGSRRYVFNPFLVYLEVLDDTGQPSPPGEAGRVVLTDLNNLVMPFIRYDMTDMAVPSGEGAVGGFPVIDHLVGRSIELLRFPSGRVLNGITLGRVLFVEHGLADHIAHYQCAKTGDDEIELRVVWAGQPTPRVRSAVADAVRTVTDPQTDIRIRDVRELDRLPSGKVWVVRDETG